MKDLKKLEEQYKRLGEEIEKLKKNNDKLVVALPTLPKELTITFAEGTMSWYDAEKWAKGQGGRLPTKLELQALAESGQIPEDKKIRYWSASSYSANRSLAWDVDLTDGLTYDNVKSGTSFIGALCVSP